MHKRGVHQKQRLCRGGRRRSFRNAEIRIRAVEEGKVGMPSIALAHQVNGAMIAFIDGVERVMNRERPAIHRRERMFCWDPWIEKAAYLEHAISDRFRIQWSAREPP